jgi:putative glycosyltransferase (TIGR04348 family)
VRIVLITPAKRGSKAGNRATAVRWAQHLRALGHRVEVAVEYDGRPADIMVALHAWRSAASVQRFRGLWPERPLILALTGTDLYRFLATDPEVTTRSMELADRLVVLHERAHEVLAPSLRPKVRVIHQSALPLARRYPLARRFFDVCVIGHLREEKDPFRAAYAARALPAGSRIRILHLGKGHSPEWEKEARREMRGNPRYVWRGEVPFARVRATMGRSRLMVLSSRMEGGANVISEACVAGLPVIASDIAGNVGLLGPRYPGYFPVEDTKALSELLLQAERDTAFYRALERACAARVALFTPARERRAWKSLLRELA